MAKRAATGLSLCVGIDKQAGMTSHDVVDACRRIYGERRIGHAGTLDPDATGALVVCVGPATRLDRFLTGHDKTYLFDVVFGTATDTDDASGQVIECCDVDACVFQEDFARGQLAAFEGVHSQLPPAYSAISKNGTRAYEAARKGCVIQLDPRAVHIYSAQLVAIHEAEGGFPVWTVSAHVSAGTYIRSIARDLGRAVGSCAHVGALRRTAVASLHVGDCISLDQLASAPFAHLLDPVRMLGMRVLFAEGPIADDVSCGRVIEAAGVELAAYPAGTTPAHDCQCASGLAPAREPLADGEFVAVVRENLLAAIYEFDAARGVLKSACGFATGVKRGFDI